jgi:P-type Na+/K+ transporter
MKKIHSLSSCLNVYLILRNNLNFSIKMYYFQPVENVLQEFGVEESIGLTDSQAKEKRIEYGRNELGGDSGPSVWKVFFANAFNSMNFILFIALIVSIVIMDWVKFTVLLIVILTNSAIGFVQEYKSEKTMDALRKMSSSVADVLRNRNWVHIPAKDIVPGDIVKIKMGDVCPGDLRLIESINLEMDEAFLTGEAVPISKVTTPLEENEGEFVNAGDRINCAFMNSIVVRGRGVGIVTATSFATEVGQIAKMVSDDSSSNKKTPLMRSLDTMMYGCAIIAILLGVVVFAADRFIWSIDTFIYAISVGIALLPEGLPTVVTVLLAISLRVMSHQKALVRKMSALESVSQVTNICSDKTGTLTEGKMTVKEFWSDGNFYVVDGVTIEPFGAIRLANSDQMLSRDTVEFSYALGFLFKAASLCNISQVYFDTETNSWNSAGNPTDIALNVFALKMNLSREYYVSLGFEFVEEFAFESTVKRMTSVYKQLDGSLLYLTKGALEKVLEISTSVYEYGISKELTPEKAEEIQKIMILYAKKGMRILALASKTTPFVPSQMSRIEAERDLTVVGLCAIYDPPRSESLPSVRECHAAGIRVHMATGDHPKTAEAIAREVGILGSNYVSGPPLIMPAHMFDSMAPEEIDEMPELPIVLARCAPSSKVTLIKALHRRGRFVAMTGDGVNDAPAVKKADIGIAMGIAGSDVTKQASSIILTDDNFQTIVVAVKEGRRLFTNITNIVQHLLSSNVSEVIVLIIGLSLRDTDGNAVFPMSSIQILWLNMITSSPVALSLGVEPANDDIMQLPPRKKNKNLASWELSMDLGLLGIIMGAFSLGSFILYIHYSVGLGNMPPGCGKRYMEDVCESIYRARALAFISLSFLILVHGFNCRNKRLSMFRRNQKPNKPLLVAIAIGVIITVPTIYIPFVNIRMFQHLYFEPIWWVVLCGEVALFIIISELYKFLKRLLIVEYWPIFQDAPNVVVVDNL